MEVGHTVCRIDWLSPPGRERSKIWPTDDRNRVRVLRTDKPKRRLRKAKDLAPEMRRSKTLSITDRLIRFIGFWIDDVMGHNDAQKWSIPESFGNVAIWIK